MWSEVDLEALAREENACSDPRAPAEVEQIVALTWWERYNRGLPCDAAALHRRLRDHAHLRPLPSVRGIGQILARHELTRELVE